MSKINKNTQKIISISTKMILYFFLILLIFMVASKAFSLGKKIYSEDGYKKAPGDDKKIVINTSDSKMDIANKLEKEKIVEDSLVFYIQTFLYEGKIKAGEYTINNSLNAEDIIELLSQGPKAKDEEESTTTSTQ